MSGGGPSSPPDFPRIAASNRLDSWKEIAAYLKREVRTVQRWEKKEGMPVHRHVHRKLGTVYAYRAELDDWWNNSHPRLEKEEPAKRAAPRRLLLQLVLGAAAVATMTAGLALWLTRPPALPFEARDWVLIAQFDNRTREEVFDRTLEYALERELSNSRFVNVVPRERISDTLELMKRSPDNPIDAALGHEICLRDGGIRALLTGRVEKLDTTYMLSVVLVDPSHGAAVAAMSEEAEGQKEVLSALHRLSDRVREVLGEELAAIGEIQQKLERVTTPSLQALQLYSRADALIYQGKSDRAEQLLKQAITEDPAFASAYVLLAWAGHNQSKPEDEYRAHALRALELSENSTVRERYFIQGSYHQLMDEPEKAAADYQALLDVYPGHYWATSNLSGTYLRLNRKEEAAPYRVRRADMRPHSLPASMGAVEALADWKKDLTAAAPYMRRAEELAALPEVQERFPLMAAKAHFLTAAELWQRGEFGDLLSELDRLSTVAETIEGEARIWFLDLLGQSYLSLRHLERAEKVFDNIPDPDWRRVELALLALAADDREALRRHAYQLGKVWLGSSLPPIFMARAGLLVEAQRAVHARREEYNSARLIGFVQLMEGDLALAGGRAEEATRLIQVGLEASQPWDTITQFLASDALATAWEMEGNRQRAIEVLEEAVMQGDRLLLFPRSSVFWVQTQARLARLYRELGRPREAQEVESALAKVLTHADPEHSLR